MPINTTHSRCISPSRARSCRLAAQPIGVRYLMGFFQRRRRELVAAEPSPTSHPEPVPEDPRRTLLRVTSEDSILHHHALLLSMALDLLAYEWRSERITEQVDALDGMGAPGRWLEELYAQLRVAVPSSGPVTVGG